MPDLLPGFAPIHAGWNVWDLWQKKDLDFELGGVGLDNDRRLRIFVENTAGAVPGVTVNDAINPAKLVGDMIEILPNVGTLEVETRKENVPGPALTIAGDASLRTVRFFNRGHDSITPWPHTSNYLLNATYVPSATDPITSAPAPDTITGGLDNAGDKVKTTLEAVAIAAVAVAGLIVVSKLRK